MYGWCCEDISVDWGGYVEIVGYGRIYEDMGVYVRMQGDMCVCGRISGICEDM